MRLRIALDGRDREVLVEGEPPNVRVSIAGRTLDVRVHVHEGRADAKVEGRTIALDFVGGLRIDGTSRTAHVEWLGEEADKEGTGEVVEVRSPMPGRIVRVLVAPGTSTERGAPLVVLEAMKMQNEVPAPIQGTVQEVRVREGDAVGPGDVVVRIHRERKGKPS